MSSEDEDSKTTNSNSPNADNQKKTNEKNNDTKTQTQNGAKYMFREWDIKESDVESFDKLTNGKYIHTKPVEHDKIIEKKVKNFRLGNFIVPAASTLQLSPEGIEFKLTSKFVFFGISSLYLELILAVLKLEMTRANIFSCRSPCAYKILFTVRLCFTIQSMYF